MSSWKKTILGVLVFTILQLVAIVLLVSTTSGLRLLFNAANYWIPGLEIEQVMGSWHDLYLKNIHYNQPGIMVNAAKLHLVMQVGCLRDGLLCMNELSLEDVNVAIDSNNLTVSVPIKKKNKIPLKFSIPYPILLYRLALNNINIKFNDTIISVKKINSGLRWKNKSLTLTPTSLRGLLIALPKETKFKQKKIINPKIKNLLVQKKFLEKILKNIFSKPLLQEMNDIYLPLNLNIEELRGKELRLRGNTNLTVFNMLVKMSAINSNVKLDTFDINTNQGSVHAIGNAQLRNNWPVDIALNLALDGRALKGEKINLKVSGALHSKLKLSIDFSGPLDMLFHGYTQLAKVSLPLDLEITSKQICWPFRGNRQFQANNIKLKLKGELTDYIISFRTTIKGNSIPTSTIILHAKGNEQQINLEKLTIETLGGKTELTALVNWQPAISWSGNLKLISINRAKEIPEYPYKIDGIIKACGGLYGGVSKIDVPKIKLIGNVKKTKIKVDGSLKGNDYLQWIIPSLYAKLGQNTITVKGKIGIKDLDLYASVNAENLGSTLSKIGGTIKGFVKIHGTAETPQLLVNITGNNLYWRNFSIAHVQMDGDLKKSTEQISGKLNLHMKNIMQPGLNIRFLTLASEGNEKHHDLLLRVEGEPLSGKMHLTGSFDRQTEHWKGQLNNAQFDTPIGLLMPSHAITLDYRRNFEKKISIGPHCWSNSNIELCLPKTIDAGIKGNAVAILKRFNLMVIHPFMPATIQAQGLFNGEAKIAWDINKKGVIQAGAILSGHNVQVIKTITKEPLTMTFDALNFNIQLNKNSARLDWLAQLTNNGKFEGQIKIHDSQGLRNLTGTLRVHNFNLAIANGIFSDDITLTGILNANLQLAANTKNPQLFGQIQVNDLGINGNSVPFNMQPSQLLIRFSGINSTLIGEVRTAQGKINLSGNAYWSQIDNWGARVVVKGSHVRIAVPPILQIDISPDLVFETTPSLRLLNGSIDVPWARIVLHDMPESIVRVSKDEVLLNESLKPIEQKGKCFPIYSNLIVRMGNDVQLNTFGLKTKLTGNLKVTQDNQGLGLNGQINIFEGAFQSYGQNLIIRKGEVLFSGLLDQAVVNIEAIRNPDSTENGVIAGIHITGSIDEPKIDIFTDPKMSKQEAISYLLRGKGLNGDQRDSETITSMLIGLGISQSGQIISKIGKAFGIKNLSLDTQGIGDSTQIVLSGYVLPSLQVKYGVGIFNSLATLTLRYRLMSKLYLEVVSGIEQALDLLYQIDF